MIFGGSYLAYLADRCHVDDVVVAVVVAVVVVVAKEAVSLSAK
jgi:hypothetical protein